MIEPSHVTAVDPKGAGTLMWATCATLADRNGAQEPCIKLIRILARLGAHVDQRTEERTALMLLARACNVEAVGVLLSLGAEVQLRDTEGWTALMCACMVTDQVISADDRLATVNALLDAGAEVDDQNSQGMAALHLAALGLDAALLKLLLARGACLDTRGLMGSQSALAIAKTRGSEAGMAEAAAVCVAILDDAMSGKTSSKGGAAASAHAKLEAQMQVYCRDFMDNTMVAAMNESKKAIDAEHGRDAEGSVEGRTAATKQETHLAKVMLRYFGMDTSVLEVDEHGRAAGVARNWYGELHAHIMRIMPPAFKKIYPKMDSPTEDELALLVSNCGKAFVETDAHKLVDTKELANKVLSAAPMGAPGFVANIMLENFYTVIHAPLAHSIAFAVPNQQALDVLAKHAPLLELGAGTGYWASLLRGAGVDVLAYDRDVPSAAQNNLYFAWSYGDVVQEARGEELLRGAGAAALCGRTLVLVWPRNPDEEQGDATEAWDAASVKAYHEGGGKTVVHVGEQLKNAMVRGTGGEGAWGVTSSRDFQHALAELFTLQETIPIPRWPFSEDEMTVWVRK